MTDTNTVDLVVVGAGLGGLLTAAHALQRGHAVTLLERASVQGGLARSPLVGGLPMNLGPHALYLNGPAHRALQTLAVPTQGFMPGAGTWLALDGALVPSPSHPLALLTARWLSWRERAELAVVLAGLRGQPPRGTVEGWLTTLRSPRVRAFCAMLVRLSTYTHAPGMLSARLAWAQLARVIGPRAAGVQYIDGGWQSLVDHLAARVPVRTGVRVTRVEPTGTVHTDDGGAIRGRAVALAVPLRTAASLVDDADLRARAAAAVPVRAACLDVVLSRLPVASRRLVLGVDEPLYASVHSPPAAPGAVLIHVARYVGPHEARSDRETRATLEDFLSLAQPGWQTLCTGQRYCPSLTVMDDVPREAPTTLRAPWHLVSTVATRGFLLDGVAEAAMATVNGLAVTAGVPRAVGMP